MGEHRAVIGVGVAGFDAARRLAAVETTVSTGCAVWPPTHAVQCCSVAIAEGPVAADAAGALVLLVEGMFDSGDRLAGAIRGPEAAQ